MSLWADLRRATLADIGRRGMLIQFPLGEQTGIKTMLARVHVKKPTQQANRQHGKRKPNARDFGKPQNKDAVKEFPGSQNFVKKGTT